MQAALALSFPLNSLCTRPLLPTEAETAATPAVYIRCNAAADASSVGAVSGSMANLKSCHIRNPADPTECTAEETTTMLAEYPIIAAAKATCLVADGPSNSLRGFGPGAFVTCWHTAPNIIRWRELCAYSLISHRLWPAHWSLLRARERWLECLDPSDDPFSLTLPPPNSCLPRCCQ